MKHLIDTLGIKAPPRTRIQYNSDHGDFRAFPHSGTRTMSVEGLPFTLQAEALLSFSRSGGDRNMHRSLENITVSGNTITLDNIREFDPGENITLSIIGPDKSWQ